MANFLGTLAPGGTPESAGHDRTYVVTYQVDFLRSTPAAKLPEESLSYSVLQERGVDYMLPRVYFGENVLGKYDPARPASIAVRANFHDKEVKGYMDARKLWLEPPLDPAESDRYMAVGEAASVHVVPDPASPPVLTILQGEVVETVGQLNFQGQSWIKGRFNAPETPRYGFIQGSDLKPLSFASVNQSEVTVEEISRRIRKSDLKFSEVDRQRLSQNGFYIEPVPPEKSLTLDDMAEAYQWFPSVAVNSS